MTPSTAFVYGLLKPGYRLHHVVASFVTDAHPASHRGRLYDAGVPAARFDADGTVEGYLLALDPVRIDQAVRILDDLEDEGERYRRVVLTIEGQEAFAYEWMGPVHGLPEVGPSWPEGR